MRKGEEPRTVHCSRPGCRAEYVVLAKDYAPSLRPQCIECDIPLASGNEHSFLHYQLLRFD
jgi:hypothetical protein